MTTRTDPELMAKRLRADIIPAGETVARALAHYLEGSTFDGLNGETERRAFALAEATQFLLDKADALVAVTSA